MQTGKKAPQNPMRGSRGAVPTKYMNERFIYFQLVYCAVELSVQPSFCFSTPLERLISD